MAYYSEITASVGLKLEPDTSPYTGTTMGAAASVIDGMWDTKTNVDDWESTYSYGIDLGSSVAVDRLFFTVNKVGTWQGANNSTFSVYKSDDNSTWSFIQTFISPEFIWAGNAISGVNLDLTSQQTARYFKIVNSGSGTIKAGVTINYDCEVCQIIAYEENSGADPNIRVGVASSLEFNASDKHASIALSNDNLTATMGADTRGCARASRPIPSSGKWYWEVTFLKIYASNVQESINRTNVGVGTAAASLSESLGFNTESWAMSPTGSVTYDSTANSSVAGSLMGFQKYIDTYYPVIGIAFDADAGKIWFRWHTWGDENGLGDPAAGTNAPLSGITGTVYPMISFAYTDDQMTMNFGASDFTYPVPSGFNVLQEPITESVVIDSPPNVRELINRIAYEASSVEYWDAGAHNLVYLPTHTTVTKTIDANRIDAESVDVRYTDRVDLLNSLTLWYNYYWSGYSGDDAFRGTVVDSDATSIAKYGTLEKEAFQFQYLEGAGNAERAIAWLLNELKNPRLIVSFTGGYYLTDIRRGNLINFDFEDGDELDLAFAGIVSTTDKFMVTDIVRGVGSITLEAVQLIEI